MSIEELFEKNGYVHTVKLLDATDEQLMEISSSLGLALNIEEMRKI